jgi:hypothetical protein
MEFNDQFLLLFWLNVALYFLPELAKTCQDMINLCDLPTQVKVNLDLGVGKRDQQLHDVATIFDENYFKTQIIV